LYNHIVIYTKIFKLNGCVGGLGLEAWGLGFGILVFRGGVIGLWSWSKVFGFGFEFEQI